MIRPGFRSWKTTALATGKLLTVVGTFMIALLDGKEETVADLGPVVVAAMLVYQSLDWLQGVAQRDADKSSQDVGIR